MDLSDPIVWRGLERLLAALGAVVFGLLGYRLYRLGFTKTGGTVKVESKWLAFVLSGTGPGIVFMAFAALVLAAALMTGGAGVSSGKADTAAKKGVEQVQAQKYLYAVSAGSCARLIGSPDDALPSALSTSDMPWAPRLAQRISDVKVLRTVVDAICAA